MTIRQIELETISFVIIAAFISSFFVWRNNQNFQQQFHLAVPIVAGSTTVITPISNPVLKIDSATQTSPDGARKLIMKVTHNKDNTQTYVFSTADGNGANEQVIFSRILDTTSNMMIPFNAWSPDNRYFFIQENAKEGRNVMVFKASGAPFANGEAYLNATDLFRTRNTGNNFVEATGWASESLIIVNTTTKDNTKGPSYWFEVPTKAIIQLSSEF